jgi:asparagine synthetase B (glutamine-hydrolysing)
MGSVHTETICKPEDILQMLPKLIEVYDEPFGDSSALPSLLLNKVTKQYVTMALSGDGGDESFLGYNHFDWVTKFKLLLKIPYIIRLLISKTLAFNILGARTEPLKRIFAIKGSADRGRRRGRERNLYTLCWGKRAAGESSALPRRRLASSPFTLHEHVRVHLGQLLRQPRLRVADVHIRRRLRGLRPVHAALDPAATGLQPTAPHPVNTSGTRGTPCPLHQHCHSHRNAS